MRSSEIFDILSKGQFICSNSTDQLRKGLYDYIDDNKETLTDIYSQVGFDLEGGSNFYYFSKSNETNQSIEKKIERALHWLDVYAFFTTYKQTIQRGDRFSFHDVVEQVNLNMDLRDMLENISGKKNRDKKSYDDMFADLVKDFKNEGFIELENEMTQTWRILDSWQYMELMVSAVNIRDEENK